MTRARRVSQGERTHAERIDEGSPHAEPYDTPVDPEPGVTEIVHDPANPQVASTEEKVGEPRQQPDRMCKSCEANAADDTVYGVVVAPSGLGHYTADASSTLCGREFTDEWEVV